MSTISVMKDFAKQLGYLGSFELLEELGVRLDTCYSFSDVKAEFKKLEVVDGAYASDNISPIYDSLDELKEELLANPRMLEDVVLGRIKFFQTSYFCSSDSDEQYVIDDDTKEVYRFMSAIKKNQASLERAFQH